MDLKLEVIVLPVSDVDRAKAFYEQLGFRLDADFSTGPDFRVIQVTPPGSPTSIIFGKGLSNAAPGSVEGLHLVVADIEAARLTSWRAAPRSARSSTMPAASSITPAPPRVAGAAAGPRQLRLVRFVPTTLTATPSCCRKSPKELPGRSGTNPETAGKRRTPRPSSSTC